MKKKNIVDNFFIARKNEIMNCQQAQKIPIRKILESFSLFPSKENQRSGFYHSIDREERTPSLSVDYVKNTAYDFGSGRSYDNVSIVQALKRSSVSEALEYLGNLNYSFKKQDLPVVQPKKIEKAYEIMNVLEVLHPALLEYLKSRNLESQKSELCEIHYKLKGKKYFGTGFQNDSNGYEIRNKFCKICLGKKDLTIIKNQSNTVRIFEGFTDFLSFRNLEKSLEKSPSDYLVLNSVAMVHKALNLIKNYQNVELYLDNDKAGDLATEKLNSSHSSAEDCRLLYRGYKDLNDFILGKKISFDSAKCNSP